MLPWQCYRRDQPLYDNPFYIEDVGGISGAIYRHVEKTSFDWTEVAMIGSYIEAAEKAKLSR